MSDRDIVMLMIGYVIGICWASIVRHFELKRRRLTDQPKEER